MHPNPNWKALFDEEKPLSERTERAFAEDGPLAAAQPGFRPRESQTQFALAVAEAIRNKTTLLAEAGTGTGKSFAYLIPALLSGSRVIISTAGKPLQDQLFQKDIPALSAALGVNFPAAILKGRSNYICYFRLERALESDMLPQRDSYRKLREIARFAALSETGDKAELSSVPEDDPLWPMVTSTRENCLGKDRCEHWERCLVRAAREKAMQSQVVVVNHHLYLSALDVKLGSGGSAEGLLPDADLTVIDEAHQLPGIATDFFGTSFSTWQIEQIADETRSLGIRDAQDGARWDDISHALAKAVRDFKVHVVDIGLREGMRRSVKSINRLDDLAEDFIDVCKAFDQLIKALAANAGRSDELDTLKDYAGEVRSETALWETFFRELAGLEAPAAVPAEAPAKPEELPPWEDEESAEAKSAVAMAEEDDDDDAAVPAEYRPRFPAESVQWIAASASSIRFNSTPLSFAEQFRTMRKAQEGAWVFTSATLSSAGDFTHFATELGIDEARAETWLSPFNYWEQGCFYLPKLPPPTNTVEHASRVVEAAWPLVCAAKGRTFFLCTSLAAVKRAAEELRAKLDEAGEPYPLFVQGEMPKAALVSAFRDHGNAILVGSMGFWEGVDVRGEALSLVVIDKLPFAPPDDPVFEARAEAIRKKGGSPFGQYALPEAVISVKQGAGRLIRSETDRGVFMLCDSRVVDKGYGKTILNSLPDFYRTRSLEKAIEFFRDPEAWASVLYM